MRILIWLVFIVLISTSWHYCRFLAPAPQGVHGIYGRYGRESDFSTYQIKNVTKDEFLDVLIKNGIIVKGERLNDYDPPWDSLRYILDHIPCDKLPLEAYIEFADKKNVNTTFNVIWCKSEPTMNEKEYLKIEAQCYSCFESFLRKYNLIK